MTIQEFSALLEKGEEAPPLVRILQALRTCSPQQIRTEPLSDWYPWMDDRAPQALLDKPELRC